MGWGKIRSQPKNERRERFKKKKYSKKKLEKGKSTIWSRRRSFKQPKYYLSPRREQEDDEGIES